MEEKTRSELDIFKDLTKLCMSPGYIHTIAYLCFRDNYIRYSNVVTTEDMLKQFSMKRLVRTEISTLIGLACKNEIDENLPAPNIIQEYINKTEALLNEIHHSMMPSPEEIFTPNKNGNQTLNPFESGTILRESIFYGGEAAYHFQYRDLSKLKYKNDSNWLLANKGYSLDQAISVITSIQNLHNDTINTVLHDLIEKHPDDWNILDAYIFTAEDVASLSNIDLDITRNVIESFSSSVDIDKFKSLDDFNPKNAFPIINLPSRRYLLFQVYSLFEALYETPFFWFNNDGNYKSKAMQHRGEFTEAFSAERLSKVFGKNRVFKNINIVDAKKHKTAEIDVLIVFSNRAIILQAKSKKLTIAARKGNDLCLRDDFRKAVQDAYDQAYKCSSLLSDENYKLIDENENELEINRDYKEIYPFCVVSDHYPALAFQARQFLKYHTTEKIKPPFVMDVFFLDVMTEMLHSPLHLLSYINRRILYGEKLFSTHELTILSYHLKQNLWMDNEYAMMHLGDDVCADLDLAMLARRDHVPGPQVPEGILTKFKGSYFDQIINDIEKLDNPETIELGFILLTLSGDTVEMINDGISQLVKLGKSDGEHHDLTIGISEGNIGLTIHCNDDLDSVAVPRLNNHCELRKYDQKSNQWVGMCISLNDSRLRFVVNKEFKWSQSDKMDILIKDLPKPQFLKGKKKANFQTVFKKREKVGRNDKCHCGSGKKYKKCCLSYE